MQRKAQATTTSRGRLRDARLAQRLTQAQVAERLGVTQAYVSMLEQGRRAAAPGVRRSLARAYGLEDTALPLSPDTEPMDSEQVFKALAALGYPGFSHVRSTRKYNPAEVLMRALRHNDLEPRLVEGLPWLAFRYADLDWEWLIREAKAHDVQNRLGFVVSLARQLAEGHGEGSRGEQLRTIEERLAFSRLVREDTLCRDSMTHAERRWWREHRSPDAAFWNLLTGFTVSALRYVDE